jgi:pimeloyl-ACP methyl ester carboxylesterase/DNA-binding CsgD family transcriptional regulator
MSQARQDIRFCQSSDGVRIAYASSGSGFPLVRVGPWLTHAELDWSSPIWLPWLKQLASGRTLIHYDFRGHGLSDRMPCDAAFERQVDDLAAVLASTHTKHCALLGIAGGCAIAIAYAVRWPEHVDRLVLFGGFTRGSIARSRTSEEAEAARTVLRVMELSNVHDDPAFRQLFTAQCIPDAPAEQSQAFNQLMRISGGTRASVSVLRALYEVDVRALAPKVRCPTLVLHPTNNLRVPYEEGRSLAALIPKARFVPLQSQNSILLEHEAAWDVFVTEVQAFLSATRSVISPPQDLDDETLTTRERSVLELVAQGLDNRRIAGKLGISEKTVRNYVSSILEKLGFQSRTEAIVRAREAGFGRKVI